MKINKSTTLKTLFFITSISVISLFFIACDKNNDPPASNFTWTYDGVNYTANLDTAYTNIAFGPLILASRGNSLFAPSAELQIAVTGFSPGTYTFSPGGPNRVFYVDSQGFSYASNTGSITITSNSNNYISGNFTSALNSGKTISGNFTNTPVKP